MSLGEHVRTLGRGPGRSRSLTREEAADAMHLMLRRETAPEATGALLMLLRMKGETADEIAGFAEAAQQDMLQLPQVDLDWPSYAAGRTRGAPWFLRAAKLVAQAGHRVMLHGWNGADPKVRAGLTQVGIGVAQTPQMAETYLARDNIVYLPLENMHPELFRLLCLRDVLHLRSCVNTVCRMLNPGAASASVQGVFHPSYRLLQADAGAILGWRSLSVIKGGGGEFERHPAKKIAAFGLRNGQTWEDQFAPLRDDTRRLSEPAAELGSLQDPSEFERDVILGTLALALETLGDPDSMQTARDLWTTLGASQAA
ncbi:glycosyl transferase family protein [Primorskyibacter sp. S187A]|uniref:glycosyl transferase family protein n=1 Tax=Primorskyibacter sp. S187A TaxID=3415130 RepID=UPI003C7A2E2B